MVKELLSLKANVDLQDAKGYSALIHASKGGSWEIVQILLANGAILDLKEREVSLLTLRMYMGSTIRVRVQSINLK